MTGYRSLVLAGLTVVALTGCLEEFQNPTVLDSLRVLAAQVEPPEIRPDQEFTVRPLLYSPRTDAPEIRWAMCLLEAPFTRPLGGGGGGGFSERPPSEQEDPPPSCVGREDIIEPVEILEDGAARFEIPFFLRGLLDQLATLELPDIDPEDIPEDLRELLNVPDQFLLAVLHGVNVTVSMEVSDGEETLQANKRLPIKLISPPGPATTMVHDAEPGPATVEFSWVADALTLVVRFPGGKPAATDSTVVRVYMPLHYWDTANEAPSELPSRARGPEGAQLQWFGHGAAHMITVNLADPAPAPTFDRATAAGVWERVTDPDLGSFVELDDGFRLEVAPQALAGPAHRSWAFLVSVSEDGQLVDTIPQEGWRYVHAGRPNTNPADPTGGRPAGAEGDYVWRPDGLTVEDLETYPVVTVRGEVVDNAERRVWSWFTDAGEWSSRRTRGDGEDDDEERQNTWTPPSDGELSAERWIVVRDGRGGTAWTDLSGVLPSR